LLTSSVVQGTLLNTGDAVGVDACAGGWVAVVLRRRGRRSGPTVDRVWFDTALAAVLKDVAEGTTVGIDLPLGGVNAGWRTADVAARKLLGAQGSSVFPVPPRPVWDEDEYAAANARCRELTGQGLSRQAYGLTRRMLEAGSSVTRPGTS
jgi:predicted RNase H-like nuclease